MYPTSTSVETANVEAFAPSHPLPHVSNAGTNPRIVSATSMGDWMLGHPGCTMDDLRAEFTSVELTKFIGPARDYALRKSGGMQ